ncbi:HD domain-containing protein [Enterococcus sp. LJL120]
MFTSIYQDPLLQAHYQKIGEFEDATGGWAYHNWDHVNNVTKMVETILQQLTVPQDYLEAAKIAAILHDTGALQGKEGHAKRGRDFAKEYFATHHLTPPHQELILSAIENHSNGFNSTELMTLALIFSDKLDITTSRLAQAGYQAVGMRQLQYIKEIAITITEEKVMVTFKVLPQIDFAELADFYFMKKVYRAILAFAEKINRSGSNRFEILS